MANEIQATYDTGETLYALVFRADGQVWDQTLDGANGDWTPFDNANLVNYDVVLAEIDDDTDDSGQYRGTFPPNIASGVYSVPLYLQAGGGPVWADDDRIGETGTMHWNTSANIEITLNSIDMVLATIAVDTGTTLPDEHAALPTANEVRDAIINDATRFSGADIATILADLDATLTVGTGEIRATYNTGATLYVLMFNAAGQVWRNNAPQQFLAYAPGAIGVYDIPLSEIATDTGEYRADWPIHANMVEGLYSVVLFDQAGGGPVAADDARIGDTDVMVWDGGSDEITVPVAIDLITDTIIGADSDTLETLSDQLDVLGAGSGGTMETYTVTDDVTGFGIDGVHVWVTTDAAGTNIIWAGFTNAAGVVNYYHDLATGTTVYLWRELAGYTFTNPDSENTS